MISATQQALLKSLGTLPVQSADEVPLRDGFRPFFAIDTSSDELSPGEIEALPSLISRYLEGRYSKREIKKKSWGLDANTITLRKWHGLWQFRRFSFAASSPWAPAVPLPLNALFRSIQS